MFETPESNQYHSLHSLLIAETSLYVDALTKHSARSNLYFYFVSAHLEKKKI